VNPGEISMERADVIISSRTDEVVKVRKSIGAFSRRIGFSDDAVSEIEVAVGEALANAVCHGSPEGEDDTVEISYRQVPDRYLEIVVRDHGEGFDLQERVKHARPLSLTEGDRGIVLICALMDEVSYYHTVAGGHLHMKKHVRRADDPDRKRRLFRASTGEDRPPLQNEGKQNQFRVAAMVHRLRPAG